MVGRRGRRGGEGRVMMGGGMGRGGEMGKRERRGGGSSEEGNLTSSRV